MGVGRSVKVKISRQSYQQGADGIEPLSEEVANVWAEVEYVSQSKEYEGSKSSFTTTYVFYVRWQSTFIFDVNCMFEFNNRFYKLQSISRGNKGRERWLVDETRGKFWRVEATSQDIN